MEPPIARLASKGDGKSVEARSAPNPAEHQRHGRKWLQCMAIITQESLTCGWARRDRRHHRHSLRAAQPAPATAVRHRRDLPPARSAHRGSDRCQAPANRTRTCRPNLAAPRPASAVLRTLSVCCPPNQLGDDDAHADRQHDRARTVSRAPDWQDRGLPRRAVRRMRRQPKATMTFSRQELAQNGDSAMALSRGRSCCP